METFIREAYGPFLVGAMVNLLLYGILVVQVYFYSTRFKSRDRLWTKLYVALLFLIVTVQTVFQATFIYLRLVNNFGNMPALLVSNWLFCSDPALTVTIVFLVQMFFTRRVKLFTGSMLLTVVTVVFSTTQLVAGFITAVGIAAKPLTYLANLQTPISLWLISSALNDVTTASALIFTLHTNRTGFKSTDAIINKLILFTIQTGGLTALTAILDLITYFIFMNSGVRIQLTLTMILAHLHTNSVMSALNFRRTGIDDDDRSSRDNENALPLSRRLSDNKKVIDVDTELQFTSRDLGRRCSSDQADTNCGGSSSFGQSEVFPFSGIRAPAQVHVVVDRVSDSASVHNQALHEKAYPL